MERQSNRHSFREALLGGKKLIGLFVRMLQPEVAELFADTLVDFVILDVEHGTYARSDVSRFVNVARLKQLPILVRIPANSHDWIQHAIAVGATGVVLPHVNSKSALERMVSFARTRAIERAYAGMGRASGYRTMAWPEFSRQCGRELVVIAQIDEPEGAAAAGEIADVEGVDCLFLGSVGLALALGVSSASDPVASTALEAICEHGKRARRRLGIHLMDPKQAARWSERGVNLYVIGNDYDSLVSGVNNQAQRFLA